MNRSHFTQKFDPDAYNLGAMNVRINKRYAQNEGAYA